MFSHITHRHCVKTYLYIYIYISTRILEYPCPEKTVVFQGMIVQHIFFHFIKIGSNHSLTASGNSD